MPRARDTWQTVAPPSSLMQRNQYLQLCAEWLVTDVHDGAETTTSFAAATRVLEDGAVVGQGSQRYYDAFEARFLPTPCIFCAASATTRVCANPFVQRAFIFVCQACRAPDR